MTGDGAAPLGKEGTADVAPNLTCTKGKVRTSLTGGNGAV